MLNLIVSASRAGAEAFVWLDPIVVISITDPERKPIRFAQRNIVAQCDVQFWDLIEDAGDNRAIFNAAMAAQVLRFVAQYRDRANVLLIHCEAGISRSPGLAIALGNILGVNVCHQNAAIVDPNALVVKVMYAQANQLVSSP